jgi:hypothetical protein
MWSAPDQPFVLPARVNNFEDWADGLAAEKKDKHTKVETPVEAQKREEPGRRDRLDILLKDCVQNNPAVALHTISKLDGTSPTAGMVAVNQWNLVFTVGEKLEADEELLSYFGRALPDGKKILEDDACTESLTRVGLFLGKGETNDSKKYYLVAAGGFVRARKNSDLHLKKRSTTP